MCLTHEYPLKKFQPKSEKSPGKSATTLIRMYYHLQILQADSKATNLKDWYDL